MLYMNQSNNNIIVRFVLLAWAREVISSLVLAVVHINTIYTKLTNYAKLFYL